MSNRSRGNLYSLSALLLSLIPLSPLGVTLSIIEVIRSSLDASSLVKQFI